MIPAASLCIMFVSGWCFRVCTPQGQGFPVASSRVGAKTDAALVNANLYLIQEFYRRSPKCTPP